MRAFAAVHTYDYIAQAFVDGEYLGEFAYKTSSPWRPSLAFMCVRCGEVWGRVLARNSRGLAPFHPVCVGCRQCGDDYSVAGSLLYGWLLDSLLPQLPYPILQRELLVHLEWAEKENQCQSKHLLFQPHL